MSVSDADADADVDAFMAALVVDAGDAARDGGFQASSPPPPPPPAAAHHYAAYVFRANRVAPANSSFGDAPLDVSAYLRSKTMAWPGRRKGAGC